MDDKLALLCVYASGTLLIQDNDSVDATAKKLVDRLTEIDREMTRLRAERNSITTALSVAGLRPPESHHAIYSMEESRYLTDQPFKRMSLTDSCLTILRDFAEKDKPDAQWLDKNQVEYLVQRGGFEFKTEDPTNSVNVTLRRLAEEGYCEAHGGKGSRAIKYRFRKDRVPTE